MNDPITSFTMSKLRSRCFSLRVLALLFILVVVACDLCLSQQTPPLAYSIYDERNVVNDKTVAQFTSDLIHIVKNTPFDSESILIPINGNKLTKATSEMCSKIAVDYLMKERFSVREVVDHNYYIKITIDWQDTVEIVKTWRSLAVVEDEESERVGSM